MAALGGQPARPKAEGRKARRLFGPPPQSEAKGRGIRLWGGLMLPSPSEARARQRSMFQKINSPNYWKERKGFKPEAIVIHIADGNRDGCISWFLNPASQVSAHYLICKNGDIIQFVDEKDSAWHCGFIKNPKWELLKPGVNPNRYTVGIEHEGVDNEQLTFRQLYISSWLIFKISEKWNIPLDKNHIIPHRWIHAGKICPGDGINLKYLIKLARLFRNN